MMHISSRKLTTVAALIAFPTVATGQAFPEKPLRMIVPYAAGGAADLIARTLNQGLQDTLGQPVVIDYRPSVASIVGAEAAAKAMPDGYTIFLTANTAVVSNPAAYRTLPYDPVRDFTAISRLASNYHLFVARSGFAPNNIPELVALAKSKPNSISYGSLGHGSSPHLAMVLLEEQLGIKMLHVPYKGLSQIVTDLLGGSVDITPAGPSVVSGLVKAGKLKPLVVTSEARMIGFPDVPSMQEIGYRGFTTGTWYVMMTRSGTPDPIVNRLNRDINSILQRPAVKASFEAAAFDVDGKSSPAEVTRFIAGEYAKWGKIIRDAKIQLD